MLMRRKMKNLPGKHQSYICTHFWQLIGGKPHKFINRSFHLYMVDKFIKVPGIFGIGKQLKINLCNVKEIREGFATDKWIEFKYRQKNDEISKDFYYFSIILKSTSIEMVTLGCSLDLMTDKFEDFQLWVGTLRKIICETARIESKVFLKQIVFDENNNINYTDFDKFLVDTKPFVDILFNKYAISQTNFMDAHGLQQFFAMEQKEMRSLEECSYFISYYNGNIHKGYEIINQTLTENYLSRRAFHHLFEGDEFALFNQQHTVVCQDMTQPMSHYFIASSHNSYLSGNQITSNSSYEMYRKILLNGCRCIEVDVWEDNAEKELVVYHGKTMTSKIFLRGVLETINEVAFAKSEYPVIVSIENRCKTEESQYYMAQMIKEIFKDKLHSEPVDEASERQLPSPEAMKGKIFIKGMENCHYSDSESEFEFEFESEMQKEETTLKCFDLRLLNSIFKFKSKQCIEKRSISPQESVIDGDFASDTEQCDKHQIKRRKLKSRKRSRGSKKLVDPHQINRPESLLLVNLSRYNSQEIVSIEEIFSKCSFSNELNTNPKFSKLINYFRPRKFLSMEDCLENFQFFEMISRNELASKQLIRENLFEYRKFSSTNMVRVYPHAWRQDSSNYIPVDHWNAGAQMVALNYQQMSMPMLANFAFFNQNGNCGYVLKPNYLLNPQPDYDQMKPKVVLKIKVLSGQFWQLFKQKKKKNETCLKVTIRIHSTVDKLRKSTKCVCGNALNPNWNEEFTFKLANPELSFVQFTLVNKNSFVGQYTIVFPAMTQGFRHISLYDSRMKIIKFSRIFLFVDYFDSELEKTN